MAEVGLRELDSKKTPERPRRTTRAYGSVMSYAASPAQSLKLLKNYPAQFHASSEFMATMYWNCSNKSGRCCTMNRLTASFANILLR